MAKLTAAHLSAIVLLSAHSCSVTNGTTL